MKASKEAIVGVFVALSEGRTLNLGEWAVAQNSKVEAFVKNAAAIAGISAEVVPDPVGMPFSRAQLRTDLIPEGWSASEAAAALQAGTSSI